MSGFAFPTLVDAVFDHAPIGLAVLDRDLRYVRVNAALAEMNGVPAERHVGRTVRELLPELGALAEADLRGVLATGQPIVDLEFEAPTPAMPGVPRRWREFVYPLRDDEGTVSGLGAVVIDVTDQRRVERERDESLAVLDAVFAAAPVGLALWDRELRYVQVNEALAEINGVPIEEHYGRAITEVVPDVRRAEEVIRAVVEDGAVFRELELSGMTPREPAAERHWLTSYFPVRVGDETVGAAAVIHEVTDRKRAEQRERALHARIAREQLLLEQVVRNAGAGIAVCSGEESRFALVNDRFAEIVPARGELTGRPAAEVVPEAWAVLGPLLADVRRSGVAVVRDELAVPFERDARAFEGHRHYTVSLTPVPSAHGAETDVLIAAVEVTELVAERERLRTELAEEQRIAETLQRALLPQRLPEIPGAELLAEYLPAGSTSLVGGDFYDVFASRDGWGLVIGDVCGKGADAAAQTALIRHSIRATARHDRRPDEVLRAINAALLENLDGDDFCTAVCLFADPVPEGLRLQIACAGHPPPIVVGDGSAEIGAYGQVLGALAEPELPVVEAVLRRGQTLLLYTDGVLDAARPQRPRSIDDIVGAVAEHTGPRAMVDAALAHVRDLAPIDRRDDIAVLALHLRAH